MKTTTRNIGHRQYVMSDAGKGEILVRRKLDDGTLYRVGRFPNLKAAVKYACEDDNDE